MKPAAVVLVLSLGVFATGPAAQGQAPWQVAEQVDAPPPHAGSHFEPCPLPWTPRLPAEAPDAFLWAEYRGAYIEHDLYRPRYLMPPEEARHTRAPLLSAVGSWLDGLFSLLPLAHKRHCPDCERQAADYAVTAPIPSPTYQAPTPATPLLAPVPLPDEPAPGRLVPPQLVQPQPIEPAPIRPFPNQPAPNQPAPIPPAPAPRTQTDRPPTNAIPPRLVPPRTPVVELAPEPALPREPSTSPAPQLPRNRLPRPGEQLPRNTLPRSAAPRSTGGQ